MKMRSKKTTTKQDAPAKTANTSGPAPPAADPNPPKLFVLPKDTSPDARIVTLSNPSTGSPYRYFCCPNKGFYEFTKVAAPKTASKSWLLAPQRDGTPENEVAGENMEGVTTEEPAAKADDNEALTLKNGYTLKSPDLFVATPVDPLFLVLPALAPSAKDDEKQLFLSIEDHLESLGSSSAHLQKLLRHDALRNRLEERMGAACDTVDAGDENMYRLSIEKLAKELLAKAERLVANGLPASMEEKFVRKALEMPVMSIKREESSMSAATDGAEATLSGDIESQATTTTTTITEEQTTETQDSTTTVATTVSEETVTVPETKPPISAPEGVPHLLRLRTILDYMSSAYLPATIRTLLKAHLSSNESVDFSPLDKHLEHLSQLRSEAHALRSLSDNISRKRGVDDEEASEVRAEKKRKKDEEETKKKNQSRGVKQLAKADTSGMKKLSSFFTKAPAKK